MKILGIDFETTGLDPKQNRIIEVGAVLWDWEQSKPLSMLSELIIVEEPLPEEIVKITGITDADIQSYGIDERSAIGSLSDLLNVADYAMAHNGTAFDKLFYDAAANRLGCSVEKTWLDTKIDIKFPESITTRNLRHLAAEHGFLNPFAHRAVFDVLTMLKVAKCYDIQQIIERSLEPTLYVQAVVSFDDKDKAKARGYYWHGPNRIWWRTFKQSDYTAEKDVCGFVTRILPASPEA